MIEFRVFDDLEALSRAAVDLCLEKYEAATGGMSPVSARFCLGLSGGKTPGRAYELLGQAQLDWRRVHIYWVDERYVPPDHLDSNEGLARKTFIGGLEIPPENVHPIYLEGGADVAAEAYAERLKAVSLDFCFMGLGSDGHTASLFPGDEASLRNDALAVHTHSPAGIPDRISLTPAAFRNAKTLAFLVSGADKCMPLQRVVAGERIPSRVVAESAMESIFLVDRAASGE